MHRLLVVAALALCTPALAHPGHSSIAATFDEWLHLLLSPDHLFGSIAALSFLGAVVAVAVKHARKGRRNDPR
jgi:hypothetical protein